MAEKRIETRAVWQCTECPPEQTPGWLYPLDAKPDICPRAKVTIDGRVIAGGCMGKLFDTGRKLEVDMNRLVAMGETGEQSGG